MADPVRLSDALPDAFVAVLEAAWRRDGLAWSPEPPRPSCVMPWETGQDGATWPVTPSDARGAGSDGSGAAERQEAS